MRVLVETNYEASKTLVLKELGASKIALTKARLLKHNHGSHSCIEHCIQNGSENSLEVFVWIFGFVSPYRLSKCIGLPRKQKISVKKIGSKKWNWREMPTILGDNFPGKICRNNSPRNLGAILLKLDPGIGGGGQIFKIWGGGDNLNCRGSLNLILFYRDSIENPQCGDQKPPL